MLRQLYGALERAVNLFQTITNNRPWNAFQWPSVFEGPRTADGQPLGVTAKALLKYVRCTQPSLNEQMKILIGLGLVESRKVGRWVVYTRDEERIRQLKQTIIDHLLPPAPAEPGAQSRAT